MKMEMVIKNRLNMVIIYLHITQRKIKNQEDTLAQVQDDFIASESGFIRLGLDNTSAQDYYMTYMPIGMNDWMLCYIVRSKQRRNPMLLFRNMK